MLTSLSLPSKPLFILRLASYKTAWYHCVLNPLQLFYSP